MCVRVCVCACVRAYIYVVQDYTKQELKRTYKSLSSKTKKVGYESL